MGPREACRLAGAAHNPTGHCRPSKEIRCACMLPACGHAAVKCECRRAGGMRCRCGGESSAAARRRRRGEGATNASVKVSRGWRRRNHLLAASGLHGPGPAEAADTGGPTDTAHTVGRHTRMCRLCTPPRAVGRGRACCPWAGCAKPRRMWECPNPPLQTPKGAGLLYSCPKTITLTILSRY